MPSGDGYKNYATNEGMWTRCSYFDKPNREIKCEYFEPLRDTCRWLHENDMCCHYTAQDRCREK